MKITFLSPALNMGGGIKVLAIYSDFLVKQGHSVTVVSLPHGKPTLLKRFKSFLQSKPIHQPSAHIFNPQVVQHVINEWRPIVDSDLPDADVAIATWWETAEWLDKIDANKGKKVYFVQGHEVWHPIPKERSAKTYAMNLHKVVVSKWLQDIMRNEYGANHVDLVPNAVDKVVFNYTPRSKQAAPAIGFLLHNAAVKGLDVAVEVVNKVKKVYPNLQVIAFGSQVLSHQAVSALPEGVTFSLLPTAGEIKAIYQQCDVWLSPSRSEGFNLTAMEAMACGTPVVSTKTGWPLEAIEQHKNGVLAEIDDVSGLAEGVKWALGLSADDWAQASKLAYQATEEVSWEKSAAMFEAVLKKQVGVLN